MSAVKPFSFETYRGGLTLCPVYAVTPPDESHLHTFFDICPWSPDGRYLVTLRLPGEDREPVVGDSAEICIFDFQEMTYRAVARTQGWALQTGAHQQWGPDGHVLYFNDLIDGKQACVKLDVDSGERTLLQGPLYMISPQGRYYYGPALDAINISQKGYGVPIDDRFRLTANQSPSETGVWRTDTNSGDTELIVTGQDIIDAVPELNTWAKGWMIFFHTKVNRQGTRCFQVVRNLVWDHGLHWQRCIVSFQPDGSDIRLALSPEVWSVRGHHPDWYADGERITLNLTQDDGLMRIVRFRYDGSDLETLCPWLLGGGHPSCDGEGRYFITDAYVEEPLALKNNEVPLRLFRIDQPFERRILDIRTLPDYVPQVDLTVPDANPPATLDTIGAEDIDKVSSKQSANDVFRLDPHPAWNREYTRICFNASPRGRRQVFIAELDGLME